jgi:hypothetical protein
LITQQWSSTDGVGSTHNKGWGRYNGCAPDGIINRFTALDKRYFGEMNNFPYIRSFPKNVETSAQIIKVLKEQKKYVATPNISKFYIKFSEIS